MDNPMVPQQQAAAPAPSDPMASLVQAHGEAKAAHAKLSAVASMQSKVRAELDELVKMGPNVSQDDVLEGMSKLVAGGADPKAMIALMAGNPQTGAPPMPNSGEALASWLQQQDSMLQQHEQALGPAQEATQHALGVTATKVLLGHHIAKQLQAAGQNNADMAPPTAAAPSNPLVH